jgi:hypothetical protein
MKRIALLLFATLSVAAEVQCPIEQPPTLTCSDFSVIVRPATCTRFENPCNARGWRNPGDWLSDGFGLYPRPASVYIRTSTVDGQTVRDFCSVENGPAIVNESIVFKYGVGAAFGTGHVTLTVALAPTLTMSVSPDRIDVGEASQLVATVSGGVGPYSYSWVPTSGLNATNIPTPLASPGVTTTYTVRVTDSAGAIVTAAVTVRVNYSLLVTANPTRINAGDGSQLDAMGAGGTLPYTFTWTPPATLDNATIANPLAIPPVTTTYHVTAIDGVGVSRSGAVEVVVVLQADPPTPAPIAPGQSVQLDANPSGGDGADTYAWTPAAGLSDPAIRNPVASPAASTVYTVVVSDSHGQSVSRLVPVAVNAPATAPTAAFTFTRTPSGSTVIVDLDASTSTGNIVSYAWQFAFAVAVPDIVTTSPTTTLTLGEVGRGSITLTVTTADGQTATVTRRYP